MQNQNEHGHQKSLKTLMAIIRVIKKGAFKVRSIEVKKEMVGSKNWRVVFYLEEK